MRVSTTTKRIRTQAAYARRRRPRFGRFLAALFVALLAALSMYAWRPAATLLEYATPRTDDGRYVALRFGADEDTKRRAAYMARKFRLPLITEPGVDGVEIRSFSR